MNKKKLNLILTNHWHWLNRNCDGWESMRADLSGVNLSETDLSGVNLSDAIITGANLTGADLSDAILIGANLTGANLSRANLSGAKLTGADLSRANLHGSILTGTILVNADIYHAFFDRKDEIRKGIILRKPIKGYKKTVEGVVITAEIPAGAIVFSINGNKCRTNIATITDTAGHKLLHSQYDKKITYKTGKTIIIDNFDIRYNIECAPGFHFFRTKKEAKEY